jgi:hypothetical protein
MFNRLRSGRPWNATGKRSGNGRHDAQHVQPGGDVSEADVTTPIVAPEHYARWEATKAEIAQAYGFQSVSQWLGGSRLLCYEDGRATVELRDDLCLEWVSNRWAEQISEALSALIVFVAAEKQAPAWA